MARRRPERPRDEEDEVDEPRRGAKRSSLLTHGAIGAVVLAVVALAGWFLWPSDGAPLAAGEEDRRLPHYYAPAAFRSLLVNPSGTNASRYLSASIELGLKAYDRSKTPPKDDMTAKIGTDGSVLPVLDRYASKMRAIMSEELAKRGIADFDRRDLIPVQERIRDRINAEVLRPAFRGSKPSRDVVVVEVLFTDLILQ